MFTYNITNLTSTIRKKLNRERLNVGRSTYSGRVKDILLTAESNIVNETMINQAKNRYSGNLFDELSWIEVSSKALNLLNQSNRVVFLTDKEIQQRPDILDWAKRDSIEIVSISEREKEKLDIQMESGGPEIRTSDIFIGEINETIDYKFVEYENLDLKERKIFDTQKEIYKLIEIPQWVFPKILISETMRINYDDTCGIWDASLNAIVIKRNQLASIRNFSSTLIHELGHMLSGACDCTRAFESELTDYIGKLSEKALHHGL